jgi:hypothetical protein
LLAARNDQSSVCSFEQKLPCSCNLPSSSADYTATASLAKGSRAAARHFFMREMKWGCMILNSFH